MIALTSRQRNIIEYLLDHDTYVTNDVLASNFDVSNRTVRKDLEVIDAYLKEAGSHLIRKPGSGVLIEEKKNLCFDEYNYSYSKEERIALCITSLLLNDVNTFVALASDCQVSKQTIINDIRDLEKYLKDYRILVIKNQGVGTSLSGNEADIRRLFIDLLFSNEHSKMVSEFCLHSKSIQKNMDLAQDVLNQIESTFQHKYVDRDRILIVLCFLMNRIGLLKESSSIQNLDVERICSILSSKITNRID